MCITTPETEAALKATSLSLAGRQDSIILVGPSMQGVVFASRDTPTIYRLIPLDDMPAERRHAMQAWAEGRRDDPKLPVVEFARATAGEDERSVYAIAYGPSSPVTSLAAILAREPLRARLACAAHVVQRVASWQDTMGKGLYFMPSDIVFGDDDGPSLLPMPSWRSPATMKVLRNLEWVPFLPPEFFTRRSKQAGPDPGDAADRFALGMCLLRCLCDDPPMEPLDRRLLRAATGTLAAQHLSFQRVASWQSNLSATRSIVKLADELTHPDVGKRCGRPLRVIADLLESAIGRLDARYAVIEERRRNTAESALTLLHEILLEEDTPDLHLLAGKLAAECGRVLQAIDLLERAMTDGPSGDEARSAQFSLIAGARNQPTELHNLFRYRPETAAQLMRKVWRDFRALPAPMQEERAEALAEFLLWTGQFNSVSYATVIEFVNDRTRDADGNVLWWKFGLLLSRLGALAAQGRIEDARTQIDFIRQGLARVRDNKSMTPEEIHLYGTRLSHLERQLVEQGASRKP